MRLLIACQITLLLLGGLPQAEGSPPFVGITGLGFSEDFPLLPTSGLAGQPAGNAGWEFNFDWEQVIADVAEDNGIDDLDEARQRILNEGLWFDPPFTNAFDYEVLTPNVFFDRITDFPTGFAGLTVVVDGQVLGTGFGPGDSVEFSPDVRRFTVRDIDPAVDVSIEDAFPLKLSFTEVSGDLTFTMRASADAVPEPSSCVAWSLIALSSVAIGWWRRRRN